MTNKIWLYTCLMFGALFEIAGGIAFKKWAEEHQRSFFVYGMIIYSIGVVFWANSLKFTGLGKAVVLFAVLNSILAVIAGAIMFNEQISTKEYLGFFCGLMTIVLLES